MNWKEQFREGFATDTHTDNTLVIASKFGDGYLHWRPEALEAFIETEIIEKYGQEVVELLEGLKVPEIDSYSWQHNLAIKQAIANVKSIKSQMEGKLI